MESISSPTTVLIADRSAAMRWAIASLLTTAADLAVVGEAQERAETLGLLGRLRPGVLVLDPGVLGRGGLSSLPLIRREHAQTGFVVADFPQGPGHVDTVLKLGADAFVAKDGAPEAWLAAIRSVVGSRRDDRVRHPGTEHEGPPGEPRSGHMA